MSIYSGHGSISIERDLFLNRRACFAYINTTTIAIWDTNLHFMALSMADFGADMALIENCMYKKHKFTYWYWNSWYYY